MNLGLQNNWAITLEMCLVGAPVLGHPSLMKVTPCPLVDLMIELANERRARKRAAQIKKTRPQSGLRKRARSRNPA